LSIIGQISLARDMKTALQEAEDAEGEEDGKQKAVTRDAKGREILSDEEKAKREEEKAKKAEKRKKADAEVSCLLHLIVTHGG